MFVKDQGLSLAFRKDPGSQASWFRSSLLSCGSGHMGTCRLSLAHRTFLSHLLPPWGAGNLHKMNLDNMSKWPWREGSRMAVFWLAVPVLWLGFSALLVEGMWKGEHMEMR